MKQLFISCMPVESVFDLSVGDRTGSCSRSDTISSEEEYCRSRQIPKGETSKVI